MKIFYFYAAIVCIFLSTNANAQSNITVSNSTALQVMLGNYNPDDYKATSIITNHALIAQGLQNEISTDTLKKYLEVLATFENRNTGSDTISNTRGIGAARRWVMSKFDEFSAVRENRLVVSYLDWDQTICNMGHHKNMMAILPGSDTSDKSIIIIEGHIDTRCVGVCDTACLAQGEEDNGSGTVLTMELARVMSKYTFKRTIVFTPIIGEEQGLYGGNALALYCLQKGIKVKAVLNNDISGGILCGYTASASGDNTYPACSSFGAIDSTHYRLFSLGSFNSVHKQFARFVKLEYQEELLPYVTVPTTLWIMSSQDRTGRGGDHIPFNNNNMLAIRLTSANENGNASDTRDRQHTSRDVLGDDLTSPADGVLDTFYVDFNYLSRNVRINGIAAATTAIGPLTPTFTATNAGQLPSPGGYKIGIQITSLTGYPAYRVAIRTKTNDWDTVFTINKIADTVSVPIPNNTYAISVASVDADGVESLFSGEYLMNITSIKEMEEKKGMLLMPNYPNPFDESTFISVYVENALTYKEAYIQITDMQGKEIKRMTISLNPGMNETLYVHGDRTRGAYNCSLIVDGKKIDSKRMLFTN